MHVKRAVLRPGQPKHRNYSQASYRLVWERHVKKIKTQNNGVVLTARTRNTGKEDFTEEIAP